MKSIVEFLNLILLCGLCSRDGLVLIIELIDVIDG